MPWIHEYFLFTLQKYLSHLSLFDLSLGLNGFPIKKATHQLEIIQGKNETDFNTYVQQKRQDIVNYYLEHNDFYVKRQPNVYPLKDKVK